MLSTMRRKAGSWMIKVIMSAIVIVFVFWGVGSFRDDQVNRVATVNGEPIPFDEYSRTYNNLVNRMRSLFGDNFNNDMLNSLNLRRQAMDQVVDTRLLNTEADRLNIMVSDEELTETIQNYASFQNNGIFDVGLYQRVLGQNRLTPETFESRERERLRTSKVRELITNTVRVTDAEARAWFEWDKTRARITYALFSSDQYDDIAPSDTDISAYYEENEDNFKTPPMRTVQYLRYSPDEFKSAVTVSDEEVNEYYISHAGEFETPETVEARHILFKVDENAEESAVEIARQKAVDIMEQAGGGEDFAELAKVYSEGPSADKGGSLGAFKREDMVAPFSEKAFSMNPGEISEPVRTRFGWHIIKVENVNPATTRLLDEAAPEIRKKLTDELAKTAAFDAVETAYEAGFDVTNITDIAGEKELVTTDPFPETGAKMVDGVRFAQAAFSLEPDIISDVVELRDGFYLMQLGEEIPEKLPPLDDVRDDVLKELTGQKQDENAKADAETFLTALKNGEQALIAAVSNRDDGMDDDTGDSKTDDDNNDTPEKTEGMKVVETDFFTRNGTIPDLGSAKDVILAAFKLTEKSPFPETPVKTGKGYCVFRLDEKKAPDAEGFDEEKDQIITRLERQKQQAAYEKLVSDLRSGADIVFEDGILN